jgi:beta-glucanase (GH16 family)
MILFIILILVLIVIFISIYNNLKNKLPAFSLYSSTTLEIPQTPATLDLSPPVTLDLLPPATLDLSPPAALDLSPPATLDLSPPATLDLSPPATLDLSPPATLDLSPPASLNPQIKPLYDNVNDLNVPKSLPVIFNPPREPQCVNSDIQNYRIMKYDPQGNLCLPQGTTGNCAIFMSQTSCINRLKSLTTQSPFIKHPECGMEGYYGDNNLDMVCSVFRASYDTAHANKFILLPELLPTKLVLNEDFKLQTSLNPEIWFIHDINGTTERWNPYEEHQKRNYPNRRKENIFFTNEGVNLRVITNPNFNSTQRGSVPYLSSGFNSKKTYPYGYYEARYRYANQTGVNNSFWTWSPWFKWKDPIHGLELERDDEINVNEGKWNWKGDGKSLLNPSVFNAYHTLRDAKGTKIVDHFITLPLKKYIFYDEPTSKPTFHTYGWLYTEKVMQLYFDGKLVLSVRNDIDKDLSVFMPMNIIFSTDVGAYSGKLEPYYDSQMTVEYFRYFQYY